MWMVAAWHIPGYGGGLLAVCMLGLCPHTVPVCLSVSVKTFRKTYRPIDVSL